MPEFFRPSGGALYHLRALTAPKRWQDFSDSIQAWLSTWDIARQELILIGPSGGYTLPTEWLRSFAKLHCYDIDPLAAWIFPKRHKGVHTQFYKHDLFCSGGTLSTSAIEQLRARHPNAGFLFCNILGQIPLEREVSETQWQDFLSKLRDRLSGSRWASYHDLFTIEPLPYRDHKSVASAFARFLDAGEAVAHLSEGTIEITDHMMQGPWSKGLSKTIFHWSLTAQSLHLSEGIRV